MSGSVKLLRGLGDGTRLRIVNLLARRELCVCQLCDILQQSQPNISRHLACLRSAGLVQDRREGKWVFYRLAKPKTRLHERIIRWLLDCPEEVPSGLEDLEAMDRVAPCTDSEATEAGQQSGSASTALGRTAG